MPFRRTKRGKKLRPYLFQAQTATGWQQLSARTDRKDIAQQIEAMWHTLASIRAWDILDPVLAGELSVLQVYDAWNAADRRVDTLRQHLADVDLEALVDPWHAIHARNVKADSADHALRHVRTLVPAGHPCRASTLTPKWLTQQLYAYPGKRNTLRKVHSSWTGFLEYATRIHGVFPVNPMDRVPRPELEASPVRFYELPEVEQIIAAQPTEERRAFFTLMYGTAIEVSTALRLTRADVDETVREIRAAGTKAYSRDRVCRVAAWAWPVLEAYVRTVPEGPLWPQVAWDRWKVTTWHRETVEGLGLPRYPLHNARDHWAVRHARAGTPVAVIQHQLGHGTPMLTLTKYGRFLPDATDREHWDREATRVDQRRAGKSETVVDLVVDSNPASELTL